MRTRAASRLVFTPQVHHLTITAGPTPDGSPYAARFEGPASNVASGADGRTVTVTRRGSMHPFDFARRAAFITLAPGTEWDIEVQGNATHIAADLTGVRLNSLAVTGALARSDFLLPPTDRVVPIRIGSGLRWVTFTRPAGTRVALRGKHGFTSLSLDGEWVGTSAGCDWHSHGGSADGSVPGYEITLDSGSNHLTVNEQ
ncbi:hypothetical protein NGB36_27600 [Streptomyces sp. RB6PN25]|uniref:Uncharacterized protein n=1 Tax=Streptomyces humicola TaxID=2953240 RepID=A0ABT1Q2T0_9ACTN|nr:hypothetical protein [Streptomyces humicola]MCQ4084239.1 hypothetical protein [Streptomyces humicola]